MENVSVHVYRPHRNSVFVSALIVWDSTGLNSSQTQYAINAFTADDEPLTTINAWAILNADANVGDRGAIRINLSDNGCINYHVGLFDFPFQAWEGPPFFVNGDSNHFSLTFHGYNEAYNLLFYPMFPDNMYSITVSPRAYGMSQ